MVRGAVWKTSFHKKGKRGTEKSKGRTQKSKGGTEKSKGGNGKVKGGLRKVKGGMREVKGIKYGNTVQSTKICVAIHMFTSFKRYSTNSS